ncbi:toprim domain-containing protein [Kingella kingae]|uniref:toprim domain-containing protein n=1 Tax=Kingella kingae TaxID=504 RepID=UPI003D6E7572
MWQAASALNSESESYYINRGLKQPATDAIRFNPKREYWTQGANGKAICLGAFPCLIAAVTNTQGEITGLHQTYLQHRINGLHKLVLMHPTTGEALSAKKMLGRVTGASVAIGANNDAGAIERDDYCLVAEGIESALAAQSLFHLTAYAALSANGLTQWIAPPQIKRVLIIADNDTPRPIGRQAAENLAKRLKANGLQCNIFEPPTHGHDALDFLHAIQADSSAI